MPKFPTSDKIIITVPRKRKTVASARRGLILPDDEEGFIPRRRVSIGFVPFCYSGLSASEGAPNAFIPKNAFDEPVWIQEGDLMILAVTTNEDWAITSPAGWTQAPDSPILGSGQRLKLYWKRIEAGEEDVYFDPSTFGAIIGALLLFRGVATDGSPFIDTASGTGSGSTATFPAISAQPNSTVVSIIATTLHQLNVFSNWANPNLSYLNEIDDLYTEAGVPDVSLGVATGDCAGSSSGTTTVDLSASSNYITWTCALRRGELKPYVVGDIFDAVLGNTAGEPVYYKKGDILLMFKQTTDIVTSPPDGWEVAPDSPVINSGGNLRLNVFWRRLAAGEEADASIDNSSTEAIKIIAVRGCRASGSPFDDTGFNTGSGSSATAPGGESLGANAIALSAVAIDAQNFGAFGNFSDWTNADLADVIALADKGTSSGGGVGAGYGRKLTAGSFGSTTVTLDNTGAWAAWMGVLR